MTPQSSNLISTVTDRLDKAAPLTDPLLRAVSGLLLVPHGAQKLFGWFGGYGLEATGKFFTQQLGYSDGYMVAMAAGSVEFFGGIALALGLFTRLSALAATILLFVALNVHIPNGFFWTSGGYEYPLAWLILTLTFVVKGGGHYSVDRCLKKKS